jgi:hypothetical protein
MPFSPTSYFAGVGTVFVTLAIGFGGGLLLSETSRKPEGPNRLERVTASAAASQSNPGPVPASAALVSTNASLPPTAPIAQSTDGATNVAIRRIDETQPSVQSSQEVDAPQQTQAISEKAATIPSQASNEAKLTLAQSRSHEARKLTERAERGGRRKNERAKWTERRAKEVFEVPIASQQEVLTTRQVIESSEGAVPRFSLFEE